MYHKLKYFSLIEIRNRCVGLDKVIMHEAFINIDAITMIRPFKSMRACNGKMSYGSLRVGGNLICLKKPQWQELLTILKENNKITNEQYIQLQGTDI